MTRAIEEQSRVRFRHGTAVIGTDWEGGFYWSDSEYHGHGEFPDWEGPFPSPASAESNASAIFGKPIASGDRVTFSHYGERKSGIVDRVGGNGAIVWLVGGRWLHAESVNFQPASETGD